MKVKAKEAIIIKFTPAEAAQFLRENLNNYSSNIVLAIKQELVNMGIRSQ